MQRPASGGQGQRLRFPLWEVYRHTSTQQILDRLAVVAVAMGDQAPRHLVQLELAAHADPPDGNPRVQQQAGLAVADVIAIPRAAGRQNRDVHQKPGAAGVGSGSITTPFSSTTGRSGRSSPAALAFSSTVA